MRRRFIQAMVDAERTRRLEAAGYETEVVEFVGATVTPHNLLWRARRVGEPHAGWRPRAAGAIPTGTIGSEFPEAVIRHMTWIPTDRPLVFGHRGGSRLAPENTLAAFDRAVAEGVDGIELDVRLSRDGEVVVCHDARLDRTCDASGRDCRHDGGRTGPSGRGLPVHRRRRHAPVSGARTRRAHAPRRAGPLSAHPIIVEMKDDSPAMADATVGVVRERRALDRVCLGSFSSDVLRHARRLAPGTASSGSRARGAPRGDLFPPWLAAAVPSLPGAPGSRGREGLRVVTPRFVRAAHRAGVPVQVWIVDGADDIRRLLDWGVDAVITDRPDVAVRTLADWTRARTTEQRRT